MLRTVHRLLTLKPKGLEDETLRRGTPGHMRLPHRLQGQKVKSQGHWAGAYCGGHLAAQLVVFALRSSSLLVLVLWPIKSSYLLYYRRKE